MESKDTSFTLIKQAYMLDNSGYKGLSEPQIQDAVTDASSTKK